MNTGEYLKSISEYDEITPNGQVNRDEMYLPANDSGNVEMISNIPDVESLKLVDPHNITTIPSPVRNKYSTLTNIFSKNLEGIMGTNFIYATNEMNTIRSLVQTTSFMNHFNNQSFRSDSGIPGCIGAYLNQYYDIVGSLLNSIVLETDSVFSYTDAVIKMDKDLQAGITNGQIIQESEVKGYISIGLTKGPVTYEPSTQTIAKKPNIVYNLKDGTQGCIYLNGNKIEKISYHYTYNSEIEATEHISEVKEIYKDNKFIKEITQTNNYIEAILQEDAYKDKTYEEIVDEFFEGGMLDG